MLPELRELVEDARAAGHHIWRIAVVLAAIPLAIAWAVFGVGLLTTPGEAERNAERGGEVIAKTIEQEAVPAWADPASLVALVLLASAVYVTVRIAKIWWRS